MSVYKQKQRKNKWDQYKDESPEAYTRFVFFLSLPHPRYLKTVAEHFEMTIQTIGSNSAKWAWRDRAAAFEISQYDDLDKYHAEKLVRFRERDIQLADMLRDLLGQALESITLEDLKPADIFRTLTELFKSSIPSSEEVKRSQIIDDNVLSKLPEEAVKEILNIIDKYKVEESD